MAVEVTEVENEAVVSEAGQIVAVRVRRTSPSPFRPGMGLGVGASGVGRGAEGEGEGEEGVGALLIKMATEVRRPSPDRPMCRPSPSPDRPICPPNPARAAGATGHARFPANCAASWHAASWRLGSAGSCPQRLAPGEYAPSADARPAQAAARPRSPASCAASRHASWQLWSFGAH